MERQSSFGTFVIIIAVTLCMIVIGRLNNSTSSKSPSQTLKFDIPSMEIVAYGSMKGCCPARTLRSVYKPIGCNREKLIQAFEDAGYTVLESSNVDKTCFDIKGPHLFYRMVFHDRQVKIEKNPNSDISDAKLNDLAEKIFFAQ